MAEIRALVTLFGKTFPVPVEVKFPPVSGEEGGGGGGGTGKVEDTPSQKNTPESKEKDQPSTKSDDKGEPPATPEAKENQNPTHDDQEAAMPGKTSKLQEQDDAGSSNSQEKTLKKPDKILPCPRCDSLDTKFCYYNNYNVNQPRHFCKNCQRYWTAGGTMRNVPVGAGRRKNKSSSSHYRHLMTVSEASLQTVHCDISEVKTNGTVLSFGSDMPLCDSMASALNLAAEKTIRNQSTSSGFHHRMEHTVPFSRGGGEKGEEHRSQPSVTATDSISNREGCGSTPQEPATQSRQGYPLQIPYFNGSPWPHPWNAAPAFCASGIPISFYPATAYWGCAVPGGAWTVPCFSPVSSSPPPNTGGSSPNSPLGKHSRDGCVLKPGSLDKVVGDAPPEHTNQDGCIWVPKTLRIDDPDEAARSSIWATKGIKSNKADAVSNGGGGGMFKAFHPKSESKNHVSANSHFLHANPAALSRSLNFQEGL